MYKLLAIPLMALAVSACTDAQRGQAQAACDILNGYYEYYTAAKDNADFVSVRTQNKVNLAISTGRSLCSNVNTATPLGTVVKISAAAQTIRNAIKADPELVVGYPRLLELDRLAKQAGF